jgi:xanthine dehydrogenase YagR molybdenum-binding subunit
MSKEPQDMKIKVGFGNQFKEIDVKIAEGDIAPYQPTDQLDEVGAPRDRLDAYAKVTGKARYTYDRKMPGMIYGRILRAPYPNANVKSVDTAEAEKMPGVRAVLKFHEVFRSRRVRYAGAGVAAIAADTEAQAEAAMRAIKVDYEVLPFAVTKEDAMKKGAPSVDASNDNNIVGGKGWRESIEQYESRLKDQKGVADKAFEKAKIVVEGEFETQVQMHNSLETHGVVCGWDGDKLEIYASTQATFNFARQAESPRGNIKAASAHVMAEYIGGGFGSKFGMGQEGTAAALLAKQAKKPVHLMLNRREEQTDAGNRPDSKQELKIGLNAKGEIQVLRAYSWGTAGPGRSGAGARNQVVYNIPLLDKVENNVRTNCGGARAMRAPGFPQGAFALESLLDMAADKLRMDPLELRKRNDDHPIRLAEYDIGAEMIGWRKRNKNPGAGKGPIMRGMGLASNEWFQAGGSGAACLVRIKKNGSVEVRNGGQDIGTGLRTIMGQVAAEELGLTVTDVQTFIGDTNDPECPGSGGSTTTPTVMPAVRLAAHNAARELLDLVAEKMKWNADDLEFRKGLVVRKDGKKLAKQLTFKQACSLIPDSVLEVNERRPAIKIPGRRRASPNYAGFADTNCGVQFAEVEVDIGTGVVKVKRVVAVQDSGKILNAKTAESQVRGAVIQGVSYALYENRIMDRQKGHMLNADLENYKIAGPQECPQIDVNLFDVYNGKNNTNSMGLGEPPIIATAAAIANAVANAIGVRVMSIPITPKKVLEALKKGRK